MKKLWNNKYIYTHTYIYSIQPAFGNSRHLVVERLLAVHTSYPAGGTSEEMGWLSNRRISASPRYLTLKKSISKKIQLHWPGICNCAHQLHCLGVARDTWWYFSLLMLVLLQQLLFSSLVVQQVRPQGRLPLWGHAHRNPYICYIFHFHFLGKKNICVCVFLLRKRIASTLCTWLCCCVSIDLASTVPASLTPLVELHPDWPTCLTCSPWLQILSSRSHRLAMSVFSSRPVMLASPWPSSTASRPIFSTSILLVWKTHANKQLHTTVQPEGLNQPIDYSRDCLWTKILWLFFFLRWH